MLEENGVITALTDVFETFLGSVPPEFEGLLYLFFVIFLFYVTDQLFLLLKTVLGSVRWKR